LQYADCNFVLQFFVVNNKSFIKLPFYHYSFAAALLQLGYVTVFILLIYHVYERVLYVLVSLFIVIVIIIVIVIVMWLWWVCVCECVCLLSVVVYDLNASDVIILYISPKQLVNIVSML